MREGQGEKKKVERYKQTPKHAEWEFWSKIITEIIIDVNIAKQNEIIWRKRKI